MAVYVSGSDPGTPLPGSYEGKLCFQFHESITLLIKYCGYIMTLRRYWKRLKTDYNPSQPPMIDHDMLDRLSLGTVKVELQLLQLDLQLHLQQLVTLDKPCAPVTPSDNAELD